MSEQPVKQLVEQATEQAWQQWSAEHPSLASVIDRVVLTDRLSVRLRESPGYREAIRNYHQSRNELDLFNELLTLARPMLNRLLGL